MSNRYYVTSQFVVEAENPHVAELLVARRVQDFLAQSKVNALIVIEATTDTDEEVLKNGPPMLTEQTGRVDVSIRCAKCGSDEFTAVKDDV